MPVDSGTMQRRIDTLNRLTLLHRQVDSPIALILATGREPSRIQIWNYYHLIRADVQAAFFNIWQVAHKLMRHESNAPRNQASASDEESMKAPPLNREVLQRAPSQKSATDAVLRISRSDQSVKHLVLTKLNRKIKTEVCD